MSFAELRGMLRGAPVPVECAHGHLARQCPHCEHAAELADKDAEIARLRDELNTALCRLAVEDARTDVQAKAIRAADAEIARLQALLTDAEPAR